LNAISKDNRETGVPPQPLQSFRNRGSYRYPSVVILNQNFQRDLLLVLISLSFVTFLMNSFRGDI